MRWLFVPKLAIPLAAALFMTFSAAPFNAQDSEGGKPNRRGGALHRTERTSLPAIHRGAAQEKEKLDMIDVRAKEAAEHFVKGILRADVEGIMKQVDVPFFFGAMEENRENIKDRKHLKEKFATTVRVDPVEHTVVAISSFGSLPPALFRDLLPKDTDDSLFTAGDDKALKEILVKTDRVVFFVVARQVIWAIAVRVQADEPKVLGVRTHLSRLALAILVHEKEKADKATVPTREKVKETARQFLDAAKAKELNDLSKLADLPWLSNGLQIIKDREGLKKNLKSILDRREPIPDDVFLVVSSGGIRELFSKKRLAVADAVIANDDWAVLGGREGKATGDIIWVRVREGKGKVIGFD